MEQQGGGDPQGSMEQGKVTLRDRLSDGWKNPFNVSSGRISQAVIASVIIFVVAFIVRAVGLSRGFELWVDEMRYADLGRSVSLGQLPNLADGPFFLHPPGFFLLEAAVIDIFRLSSEGMELVYQLRWVNVVLGSLSAALTFLLVLKLTRAKVAFVAAVVVVFEPFVLRNNSHVMLETLGVTAMLAGLLIIVDREPRRSWVRLGLGGLLLGCAVVTKDVFAVGVFLPIVIALVWRVTLTRREALVVLTGAVVPYCLYLVVLTADGTLAQWWGVKFGGMLRMVGISQSTGFNAPGAPSLIERLLAQSSQYGTSYVLLTLTPLAGAIACFSQRRDRRLVGLTALSMGFFGMYAAMFGTFEENYGYAVLMTGVPAIAVCLVEVLERRPALRRPIIAISAIPVLAVTALGIRAELTTDDGFLKVQEWMSANLPADARVGITNDTGRVAFTHDPRFGVWPSASLLAQHDADYVLTQSLPTSQGYGYTTPAMLDWLAGHAIPVISVSGPTNGTTVLWAVPGSPGSALKVAAQQAIGDRHPRSTAPRESPQSGQ